MGELHEVAEIEGPRSPLDGVDGAEHRVHDLKIVVTGFDRQEARFELHQLFFAFLEERLFYGS